MPYLTTDNMAKFQNLSRHLNLPSQEEIDALSEPSIMDEYIKQNDSEQADEIQRAKMLKWAQEAGPAISGSIGISKAAIPEENALSKWLKLRQETDPNFGKMDEVINAIPAKDPNFKKLSPEQIEKFKEYANEPLDEQALLDKWKLLSSGMTDKSLKNK